MGRTGLVETFTWWLSHLSFTNNVLTAVKGYSPIPVSSHLWTISLEEQAYMVMPLLLSTFAASSAVRRHAVAFCLGSICVLIIARLAISLADVPHPFIWAVPLRADAFLLGALAAIASKGAKIPGPNLLLAAGVALMASIALMPPIEQSGGTQVLGYTVVAVGCRAIVLASLAG